VRFFIEGERSHYIDLFWFLNELSNFVAFNFSLFVYLLFVSRGQTFKLSNFSLDTPGKLMEDFEVQKWAENLTNPTTGCGVKVNLIINYFNFPNLLFLHLFDKQVESWYQLEGKENCNSIHSIILFKHYTRIRTAYTVESERHSFTHTSTRWTSYL